MTKRVTQRTLSALTMLLIVSVSSALAIDAISFTRPMIHPDTEANRVKVDGIFRKASVLASLRYEDLFSVEYGGSGAEFTIEAVISFNDGEPVGSLSMSKRATNAEQSFPILGEFSEDKIGYYAAGFASLWNGFTDGFRLEDPPLYVDELPVEIIAPLIVPTNPALVASLAPIGGASLSDGSLVVAMSIAAATLDPWFRLVGRPGGDQVERNNYNLAGRVFTTPADTIYLIPGSGRAYYRVVDGVPGSQKLPIGNDVSTTPLAVLEDGSVIQKNVATSDVERFVGRERSGFSLATGQISYVSLIAAGPGGNLWSWDQVERRIKIYSFDGVLLESIVPIHKADEYLSPQALVPYNDGSFLMLVAGGAGLELRKYRVDGRPDWVMKEIASDFPESIPYNTQPVVDPTGQNIYLVDYMSRRVLKFYDPSVAEASGGVESDPVLDAVLELNQKILDEPNETDHFSEKARYYESIGAPELAQATWQRLLLIDPFNSEANEKVDALELDKLMTLALAQDIRTREILDTLGPESARYEYSNAIRSYEQLLARDPGNNDIVGSKRSLESYFLQKQARPEEERKPITIASIDLESIFPSLISYYRANPVGAITIENTLDEPIFDVTPTLLVPKYMEYPTDGGSVERIDPGESAAIPLFALLESSVLTLNEDLQFPARVDVIYYTGAGSDRTEYTATKYPGITVRRKTALSWDDSGKIASFIVPREQVVKEFAIKVTRSIDLELAGIPEKVIRAAVLCDALGEHGIDYIEDPSSPFSQIFGQDGIVDTVRFPRDTLQYRIGDCDDTTALLASLLESVGVRTAIMTSPGHVFMAFDTGEPESNAWLFETEELEVIASKGNVWIPVETTTLSQGFYHSWQYASRLVRTHRDEIEFLPLVDQSQLYPPMPLPDATFTIIEPTAESILETVNDSLGETQEELYESAIGLYAARLDRVSGRRALSYRNQIGVLHARFGRYDAAERAFEEIIDTEGGFSAAYVNLSNVYELLGDSEQAVVVLESGIERGGDEPDPILSISLATALYRVGRKNEATELYQQVEASAPELAARYDYLGGASTARAGTEPDSPLLWDSGFEEE